MVKSSLFPHSINFPHHCRAVWINNFIDEIQHVPNSRHVAVLNDGYFYVFDLIDVSGHRLTALEIERFVDVSR
jgi:hypothetical protein